jgi:hypothetical protein
MERIVHTQYRHVFNANGTRREYRCHGHLEIVCCDVGVYVRCDKCGEGYRFELVIPKQDGHLLD